MDYGNHVQVILYINTLFSIDVKFPKPSVIYIFCFMRNPVVKKNNSANQVIID